MKKLILLGLLLVACASAPRPTPTAVPPGQTGVTPVTSGTPAGGGVAPGGSTSVPGGSSGGVPPGSGGSVGNRPPQRFDTPAAPGSSSRNPAHAGSGTESPYVEAPTPVARETMSDGRVVETRLDPDGNPTTTVVP